MKNYDSSCSSHLGYGKGDYIMSQLCYLHATSLYFVFLSLLSSLLVSLVPFGLFVVFSCFFLAPSNTPVASLTTSQTFVRKSLDFHMTFTFYSCQRIAVFSPGEDEIPAIFLSGSFVKSYYSDNALLLSLFPCYQGKFAFYC